MKGDGVRFAGLAIIMGLLFEAAGAPLVLSGLELLANWARALPAPTEAFSSLVAAAVWPLATLVIVWWLRSPLELGATKLVNRFERDNLDFGFVKISSPPTPLEDGAAPRGSQPTGDQQIVKALLEFAGASEINAAKLRDWIVRTQGPTLDSERFLIDAAFAAARRKAYEDLKVGSG